MRKKIKTLSVALLSMAAMAFVTSCKGNASQTSDSDSSYTVEDSQVASVSAPLISDSLSAKYNKAFFDNMNLKSDTPSDSTWVQTSTGLKYAVVKEGDGIQPGAADEVTVHYIGRLLDGTVFDSSVSRGEPASFPLSQVIPGWTEGLQYMKEGGVAVFYIPSDIAYGERGGGPIPPNSDLIFDVQLISVNTAQ